MDREELIYKLEEAISEYKEEKETLKEMRNAWNRYNDPGSDPGLQYEQEEVVDRKYRDLKETCKLL